MDKLRYRLMNFMQGRYGTDKLGIALLVIYALIGFVRIFVRNKIAGIVLYVVMLLILAFAVFRMLSRNLEKRYKENAAFCSVIAKVSPHLILLKDRLKDIKTKRYRRCPTCKNVLRLPYKRGKHNVKCPKCGRDFKVHII